MVWVKNYLLKLIQLSQSGEAARDSSAAKSDAAIAKTNASDANDKAVAANALAQSAYDKLGPLNNLIQAEHAALLKARVDLAAFEKEEAATMAKATADIQTVQELAGPRRLSEVLVAQISDLARSSPGQRFVVQRENTQGGGLIAVQLATALTAGGWIDVSQSTPHFEGAAVDGIQIYCGGAVQSCLALGIMLNDWKTQETDGITRVVGPPFPQGLAVIVVGTRP